MKRAIVFGCCFIMAGIIRGQDVYIGTTMGFTDYLENSCGIVFEENGVPADPFQSLANHGATIVRLRLDLPPYVSSYSEGTVVDYRSIENVKTGMQRAIEAGLKTLLTFSYQSFTLEDSNKLNPYVAPLEWQEIASDLDKITDSVYAYTYSVLDEYCSEGLIPEIVSIGNESSWHRLMPNVPEDELPAYSPARSVALHNAGSRAVRDIASKYDTVIKVCFHMMGPSVTKWWLETHSTYGLDFDMIGISLYHGWNNNDYGGYSSLGDYVAGIIDAYGIEFIVMETAQLFTEGGNDNHVDILGMENIPPGYPNPPTTETQKQYLVDITWEVLGHGGSGVIVWGGEWVGSDCYIYADKWGKGSSWENKTFWDFNYNLHDGVNWMMVFSGKVPVTFKVDMSGAEASEGVFISGEFENFQGEIWAHNRMSKEGNNVYQYTAYIHPGASGEFYFSSDTSLFGRESVPKGCTGESGINRRYNIPENSSGEIYPFVWSRCDTIPQYALTIDVNGNGSTSPTSGVYSSGIMVSLVAKPELGWIFYNWTGDTTSSENPLLVKMDSDRHLTANFIIKPKVPVTFKVDMTGADASKGVYVTGEFPNLQGETWQLNKMYHEGGNIYSYSTQISVEFSGAYYFLNDNQWGERETVPANCAVYWGSDRGFDIPLNSKGETFAFVWSSCEEIKPVSASVPVRLSNEPLLEIYPNPVLNDQLNLSFKVADEVNIFILDLTGRVLYRTDMNSSVAGRHTIDLHSFKEGACLIRVFFRNHNRYESKMIVIFN